MRRTIFILGGSLAMIALMVIVGAQLTSSDITTDKIFTKLIRNDADLTGGYAEFEIYCPLDTCDLKDLSIRFVQESGIVDKYKIGVERTKTVTKNIYGFVYEPKWCSAANGTYDCGEWVNSKIGTTQVQQKYWDWNKPIVSKGEYKVRIDAQWSAKLGFRSADWIPKLELKRAKYPSLDKDYSLEKTAWAWWNTSWDYYDTINISNTNTTAALPVNYTVNLTIDTATLIGAGKLNADCSDLRIVYQNSTTISWLNASNCNNAQTYILFKLQAAVAASSDDEDYFLYYGNSGATLPDYHKEDVYYVFDDFEDGDVSDWSITGTGAACSIGGNGMLCFETASGSADAYSNRWANFSYGIIVWADCFYNTTAAGWEQGCAVGWGSGIQKERNTYTGRVQGDDNQLFVIRDNSGGDQDVDVNAHNTSLDHWYTVKYMLEPDRSYAYYKLWTRGYGESATWNESVDYAAETPPFEYGTGMVYKTGAKAWYDNFTVMLLMDPEPTLNLLGEESNVTVASPCWLDVLLITPNNTITNNNTYNFFANPMTNCTIANMSLWGEWNGGWHLNVSNTSDVINATSETFTVEGWDNGVYLWNSQVCVEPTGECVFQAVNFTITVYRISPSIQVFSPANTSYGSASVNLNVGSNTSVDTWWYSLNGGSNTTFSPNTTITAVIGQNYIDVWLNDSMGYEYQAGRVWFTFVNTGYSNTKYNGNAIEGSSQGFEVTLNFSGSVSNLESYLIYDGTSHSATEYDIGGNIYILSANVTVPNVTGSNENNIKQFYWNYTYTIVTETNNQTANETQTVHKIMVTNCTNTSLTNTTTLQFYLLDEEDSTALTGDFDIDFDVWYTGNPVRAYAFDNTGQTTYRICIYPSWADYTVDAIMEYVATNYSQRTYFLDNASISNSSTAVNLYLSESANTSLVTMTVYNELSQPEENVYITVQRYYIGTGTYKTIAIARTDFQGQTAAYLQLNTVWYRFVLSKNGEILATYSPFILTTDDITFRLTGEGVGEWFKYQGSTAYACYHSNTTNTTTCQVTDTSGLMVNVSLVVDRFDIVGWTNICKQYSTSSSATLVCPLGTTEGKLYRYVLRASYESTSMVLDSGFFDNTRPEGSQYGSLGVLAALLILITLPWIGAFKPSVALILCAIAVGISAGFGLIYLSWSSIMSFMIVLGIAIYKMRN